MSCKNCKNSEEESLAMYLVKKDNNNSNKWFIVAMAAIIAVVLSNGIWAAYLSQYDCVSEEYNVEQNTDGGGNIADSYVGVNGDIINGIPKDNIK